jgi:hypothetical protein
VANTLAGTDDAIIRTQGDLEYLVQHGVGVAMVYGDLDYRCNWLGAENVSLTIDWDGKDEFGKAGYVDLQTNASYVGGKTRQVGNFSFSRVYQAGHAVAAYQPETVLRIFKRALLGKDVATGEKDAGEGYKTSGPVSVFDVKGEVKEPVADGMCMWYFPMGCTDEQMEALEEGTAVVNDWVVVEPEMTMSAVGAQETGETVEGRNDGGGGGGGDGDDGDDSGAGGMVASMGMVMGLVMGVVMVVV